MRSLMGALLVVAMTATPALADRGIGQGAASFATRHLGDPYVYGGTGRRGFDCSGLVQRSWGRMGVHIPRVARDQYLLLRKVRRNHLRVGDLVFFYGLRHVGLWLGHGWFIHSPHPGSHVRIDRLKGWYSHHYVGAARPHRRNHAHR